MKFSKIAKALSVAVVAIASTASAQETITSTVTMTVQNAFDLTEVTALNFGTITAVQTLPIILDLGADDATGGTGGDADVALVLDPSDTITGGIKIQSDGTANQIISAAEGTLILVGGGADPANTNSTPTVTYSSSIREIVAGGPAEFAIANAAPFTDLTITDPDDAALVLSRAGAPASESFTLDIDLDDMTITGGARDGSTVAAGNMPQTDGLGAVGFLVGGTLSINVLHDGGALGDGVYSGTYPIVVNY